MQPKNTSVHMYTQVQFKGIVWEHEGKINSSFHRKIKMSLFARGRKGNVQGIITGHMCSASETVIYFFCFQTFFFQFQAMNLLNVPKEEAGTHDTDDG